MGFPLFLTRTANVMASCLSVVFRCLVRLGSSRFAGDRPMSPKFRKVKSSSSVDNYLPISITSVMSNVFERLVSVCVGRFMESSGVLPTTKFMHLSERSGYLCCTFVLAPYTAKCIGVGRRLGLGRLISVQPLKGSTVRAFSIVML